MQIPWRKKKHPTPVFLLRESRGQRSLVGYSPWGFKELDMTEQQSTAQYRITHRAYKHSQDRVREMKCHISYDACLRLRLIQDTEDRFLHHTSPPQASNNKLLK